VDVGHAKESGVAPTDREGEESVAPSGKPGGWRHHCKRSDR